MAGVLTALSRGGVVWNSNQESNLDSSTADVNHDIQQLSTSLNSASLSTSSQAELRPFYTSLHQAATACLAEAGLSWEQGLELEQDFSHPDSHSLSKALLTTVAGFLLNLPALSPSSVSIDSATDSLETSKAVVVSVGRAMRPYLAELVVLLTTQTPPTAPLDQWEATALLLSIVVPMAKHTVRSAYSWFSASRHILERGATIRDLDKLEPGLNAQLAALCSAATALVQAHPSFRSLWDPTPLIKFQGQFDLEEPLASAARTLFLFLGVPFTTPPAASSTPLDLEDAFTLASSHGNPGRPVDLASLVPELVNVAGVLLPAVSDQSPVGSAITGLAPLIHTDSTLTTLSGLAFRISQAVPILLEGPSGSGKTAVVMEAARLTGNNGLIKIHLGDQADAKTLLGAYVSTETPGEFIWAPGPLTTAISTGRWILIEDLHLAPVDVLSSLLPVLETRTLFIPGRGTSIAAHPGFRLFATASTPANSSQSYSPTFLGADLWSRLSVSSPTPEDLAAILNGRHPEMASILPAVMAAFAAVSQLPPVPRGRPATMRDVLKWTARISKFHWAKAARTNIQRDVDFKEALFAEAVDVFACSIPPTSPQFKLVLSTLASSWGVTEARLDYIAKTYKPVVAEAGHALGVGRATVPVVPAALDSQREKPLFVHTKAALGLMERLAVSVSSIEPVLLVGETGIGKTSVIQWLAAATGNKLVVQNLNEQSEASDLLGGFRPVELRLLCSPLMDKFELLFPRTFSMAKNGKFLAQVRDKFAKQSWGKLLTLFKNAMGLVEKRMSQTGANGKPLSPELRSAWKAFGESVSRFATQRSQVKASFAFSWVEGALVTAVREGHWVLLDEMNLATPETLESLNGLLESSTGSLSLTDKGEVDVVPRHPNFRLFAAMNPATDIGKRDLPPGLRARFTEFYVGDTTDTEDLRAVASAYLNTIPNAPVDSAVGLYTAARAAVKDKALMDGAHSKPHYSLRSFTRALRFSATLLRAGYGPTRPLYEGFSSTFSTQLEPDSAAVMDSLIRTAFPVKDTELVRPPNRVASADGEVVEVEGFLLPAGTTAPIVTEPAGFVVTPSVQHHVRAVSRAVLAGRHPVLLQGPTSSGKTTLVEYLAARTGHRFVRLNNHEHTDIQEYIGSYVSDSSGRLVFQEGVLVEAVRRGHWIVLDELNLAPSEVLEALNRLLDDNRELFIPETQEIVRPHPEFMLFATQNPPGIYGGRKVLSRAFRNRFLELHIDDIPPKELEVMLHKRCSMAPSRASSLVAVMQRLQRLRQGSAVFAGKHGFITARDLFRWADRYRKAGGDGAEDAMWLLAFMGYALLGERLRKPAECATVAETLEKVIKVSLDDRPKYELASSPWADGLGAIDSSFVWTSGMVRLFTLVGQCINAAEPALLVGETGCGKTTVFQLYAKLMGKKLHILNCHAASETADFLGGLRPVRGRDEARARVISVASAAIDSIKAIGSVPEPVQESLQLASDSFALLQSDTVDSLGGVGPVFNSALGALESCLKWAEGMEKWEETAEVSALKEDMASCRRLFEWVDGPLVEAMRAGDLFLLDEISLADDSVLERLNSVLEPSRRLVIAEKGGVQVEELVAHPEFRIFATMNPGGDYGKKELSPALRNRFTEIWVPPVSSREDMGAIVAGQLSALEATAPGSAKQVAGHILDFVAWLKSQPSPPVVSLRDLLAWARFIAESVTSLGLEEAYVQGACLVFLDGLGVGASAGTQSRVAALRAAAWKVMLAQVSPQSAEVLKARLVNGDLSAGDMEIAGGDDGSRFGMAPFLIPRGRPLGQTEHRVAYDFSAPTPSRNALRLLRAMQLTKPVLMEGSPGVGKTSMVEALAALSGHEVVRINLSEQTDIMDLFGSDLPVEGGRGGEFAWVDGVLLRGIKAGSWILLDELNLASQSVLEGLNACLDHRGEIFVPELGLTFNVPRGSRFFAAQNPVSQGGGRKGLPKSFLNRFTQVWMDELGGDDLRHITGKLYPDLPVTYLEAMIQFNSDLARDVSVERRYGHSGSPWEFNLRDVFRWADLVRGATGKGLGSHPGDWIGLIYLQRMRSLDDRAQVEGLWRSIASYHGIGAGGIGDDRPCPAVSTDIDGVTRIGSAVLPKAAVATARRPVGSYRRVGDELTVLPQYVSVMETMAKSIEMGWLTIVVGEASSGKTSLVRLMASLAGADLAEFAMNSGVDTSELLGGFEQLDVHRHREALLGDIEAWVGTLSGLLTRGSEAVSQGMVSRIAASWSAVKMRGRWGATAAGDHKTVFDPVEEGLLKAVLHHGVGDIALPPEHASQGERLWARVQALQGVDVTKVVGCFEWVDGLLLQALETGSWVLIDNVNFCAPTVLDRLNPLLESGGELLVAERGLKNGVVQVVKPAPGFRLFFTMDPRHGEISRAMRNRGVEVYLVSPPVDSIDTRLMLSGLGLAGSGLSDGLIAVHSHLEASTFGHSGSGLGLRSLLLAGQSVVEALDRGSSAESAVRDALIEVYGRMTDFDVEACMSLISPRPLVGTAGSSESEVEQVLLGHSEGMPIVPGVWPIFPVGGAFSPSHLRLMMGLVHLWEAAEGSSDSWKELGERLELRSLKGEVWDALMSSAVRDGLARVILHGGLRDAKRQWADFGFAELWNVDMSLLEGHNVETMARSGPGLGRVHVASWIARRAEFEEQAGAAEALVRSREVAQGWREASSLPSQGLVDVAVVVDGISQVMMGAALDRLIAEVREEARGWREGLEWLWGLEMLQTALLSVASGWREDGTGEFDEFAWTTFVVELKGWVEGARLSAGPVRSVAEDIERSVVERLSWEGVTLASVPKAGQVGGGGGWMVGAWSGVAGAEEASALAKTLSDLEGPVERRWSERRESAPLRVLPDEPRLWIPPRELAMLSGALATVRSVLVTGQEEAEGLKAGSAFCAPLPAHSLESMSETHVDQGNTEELSGETSGLLEELAKVGSAVEAAMLGSMRSSVAQDQILGALIVSSRQSRDSDEAEHDVMMSDATLGVHDGARSDGDDSADGADADGQIKSKKPDVVVAAIQAELADDERKIGHESLEGSVVIGMSSAVTEKALTDLNALAPWHFALWPVFEYQGVADRWSVLPALWAGWVGGGLSGGGAPHEAIVTALKSVVESSQQRPGVQVAGLVPMQQGLWALEKGSGRDVSFAAVETALRVHEEFWSGSWNGLRSPVLVGSRDLLAAAEAKDMAEAAWGPAQGSRIRTEVNGQVIAAGGLRGPSRMLEGVMSAYWFSSLAGWSATSLAGARSARVRLAHVARELGTGASGPEKHHGFLESSWSLALLGAMSVSSALDSRWQEALLAVFRDGLGPLSRGGHGLGADSDGVRAAQALAEGCRGQGGSKQEKDGMKWLGQAWDGLSHALATGKRDGKLLGRVWMAVGSARWLLSVGIGEGDPAAVWPAMENRMQAEASSAKVEASVSARAGALAGAGSGDHVARTTQDRGERVNGLSLAISHAQVVRPEVAATVAEDAPWNLARGHETIQGLTEELDAVLKDLDKGGLGREKLWQDWAWRQVDSWQRAVHNGFADVASVPLLGLYEARFGARIAASAVEEESRLGLSSSGQLVRQLMDKLVRMPVRGMTGGWQGRSAAWRPGLDILQTLLKDVGSGSEKLTKMLWFKLLQLVGGWTIRATVDESGIVDHDALGDVHRYFGLFVESWRSTEAAAKAKAAEAAAKYQFKTQKHEFATDEEREAAEAEAELPDYRGAWADILAEKEAAKRGEEVEQGAKDGDVVVDDAEAVNVAERAEEDDEAFVEAFLQGPGVLKQGFGDDLVDAIVSAHEAVYGGSTSSVPTVDSLMDGGFEVFARLHSQGRVVVGKSGKEEEGWLATHAWRAGRLMERSHVAPAPSDISLALKGDAVRLPGLTAKVREERGVILEGAGDFYHAANIAEVSLALAPLQSYLRALLRLIGAWPDHPVLLAIVRLIYRVLGLPLTAPVAKYLSGLEVILHASQEWEAFAAAAVSVGEHLDVIGKLIIRWRKLELAAWPALMETRRARVAAESKRWWLRLYGLVEEWYGPNPGSNAMEIVDVLERFVRTASFGEYDDRVRLLRSFARQAELMEEDGQGADQPVRLSVLLWNMSEAYGVWLGELEAAGESAGARVSSQMKDFIKLAKWDVTSNYYKLKEAADKVHRRVGRFARSYEDSVLRQPIGGMFSQLDGKLTGGEWTLELGEVREVKPSKGRKRKNRGGKKGGPESERVRLISVPVPGGPLPSRMAKITNKALGKLDKMIGPEADAGDVEKLARGVIERAAALSEVSGKGHKAQKKSAVTDWLRRIGGAGCSLSRVEWTAAAGAQVNSTKKALGGESGSVLGVLGLWVEMPDSEGLSKLVGGADVKIGEVWKKADRYYLECGWRMNRARGAAANRSSGDLTNREVEFAQGYLEHLHSMLLGQRSTIAELTKAIARVAQVEGAAGASVGEGQLVLSGSRAREALMLVRRAVAEACDRFSEQIEWSRTVEKGSRASDEQALARGLEIRAVLDDLWKVGGVGLPVWRDGKMWSEIEGAFGWLKVNEVSKWSEEWKVTINALQGLIDGGADGTGGDGAALDRVQDALDEAVTKMQLAVQGLHRVGESAGAAYTSAIVEDEGDDEVLELFEARGGLKGGHALVLRLRELCKGVEGVNAALGAMEGWNGVGVEETRLREVFELMSVYRGGLVGALGVAVEWHKSVGKLMWVLLKVVVRLYTAGFCDSKGSGEDADDEGEEGAGEKFEDNVEGTGMGEGVGKKDVSDEIEDEEQLLGTQNEQKSDEPPPPQQPDDIGKGKEMEADFEGEMHDVMPDEKGENEDSGSEDEAEAESMDKEMGETNPDLEEVVDERLWDPEQDDDEDRTGDAEEKYERDAPMPEDDGGKKEEGEMIAKPDGADEEEEETDGKKGGKRPDVSNAEQEDVEEDKREAGEGNGEGDEGDEDDGDEEGEDGEESKGEDGEVNEDGPERMEDGHGFAPEKPEEFELPEDLALDGAGPEDGPPPEGMDEGEDGSGDEGEGGDGEEGDEGGVDDFEDKDGEGEMPTMAPEMFGGAEAEEDPGADDQQEKEGDEDGQGEEGEEGQGGMAEPEQAGMEEEDEKEGGEEGEDAEMGDVGLGEDGEEDGVQEETYGGDARLGQRSSGVKDGEVNQARKEEEGTAPKDGKEEEAGGSGEVGEEGVAQGGDGGEEQRRQGEEADSESQDNGSEMQANPLRSLGDAARAWRRRMEMVEKSLKRQAVGEEEQEEQEEQEGGDGDEDGPDGGVGEFMDEDDDGADDGQAMGLATLEQAQGQGKGLEDKEDKEDEAGGVDSGEEDEPSAKRQRRVGLDDSEPESDAEEDGKAGGARMDSEALEGDGGKVDFGKGPDEGDDEEGGEDDAEEGKKELDWLDAVLAAEEKDVREEPESPSRKRKLDEMRERSSRKEVEEERGEDEAVMEEISGGNATIDDAEREALRGELAVEWSGVADADEGERLQKGGEMWARYERLVGDLAGELSEQLRLILEPTLASKLKGDYRTGKRINMKKVIPFIASDFKKDKIWLRRTKPSKRNYQIVVAIDDSHSMSPSENHAGPLACEAVALLVKALTQLEVGDLSVMSFGGEVKVLHRFGSPWGADSGGSMMSRFSFAQKETNFVRATQAILSLMEEAKAQGGGGGVSVGGDGVFLQLAFVVSDGQITQPEALRPWIQAALDARVIVVFLAVDPADRKESLLDVQSIGFVNGKVKVSSYMDSFPFPYYLVLRNLATLPETLADALRQWFELLQEVE